MLETGCSQTMVHSHLVQCTIGQVAGRGRRGGENVRCVHGDSVFYPLTNVTISLEGHLIQTVGAMSDTLPASVLLGTDVRELGQLLGTRSVASPTDLSSNQQVLATTTRARVRDDARKEQDRHSWVQECGVRVTPVEASSVDGAGSCQLGNELSEGLFEGGRSRTRLTRRQKCQGRREHKAKEEAAEVTSPAPVIDNLRSSVHIWKWILLSWQPQASGTVEGKGDSDRVSSYYWRNGLLHHQAPAGNCSEGEGVEQLVLPRQCHNTVLTMAHSIPIAGHLGKRKTADCILQQFNWPGVHNVW